jgi:hypothetical protein
MQNANQSVSPSMKDDESGGGSRVAESAFEVAEDAAGFAKRNVDKVREFADEKAEELVTWVKIRPITSVLIGVAFGFLLGRFSRSRLRN